MPLVVDQKINHHCRLGVWKIVEDYPQLKSRLNLDAPDQATLEGFANPKRKLEWMSVRVMLNHLTGRDNKILYNGNRKPYLAKEDYHISISHSDIYAAVLLGIDKHVGIDIEKIQNKIEPIAHKFLTAEELEQIDPEQKLYHLYLHWCAKEALYKICDRKQLSFRGNISIEPFQPGERGKLFGKVETQAIKLRLTLYYFSIENYAVVWCYK